MENRIWNGVFILYLLIMSIWDYKERAVPVKSLMLGAAMSLIHTGRLICVQEISCVQVGLGMLPGLFLLLTAWLTKKSGYADGLVLLMLGVFLGYRAGILLLVTSLLMLSLVSVFLLLLRKVKRQTQMPYLPFLTISFIAFLMGMFD